MGMPITKTICQLGFRCGQQRSQPATMASGFDRNDARNPQLHIVLYVSIYCGRPSDKFRFFLTSDHSKGSTID
jgi:hypothetical protein